jgi:hypothetical protein
MPSIRLEIESAQDGMSVFVNRGNAMAVGGIRQPILVGVSNTLNIHCTTITTLITLYSTKKLQKLNFVDMGSNQHAWH